MKTTDTSNEINKAYIWRFFAGQASNQEKDILAQWVKQQESNKIEFQRVRELYYNTQYAPLRTKLDKKKAFARLQNKATHKHRKKIVFRSWMSVAAMVTIVTGTGLFFYLHSSRSNTESIITYSYSKEKSNYLLPDNSTIQLNKHSQLSYNNAITEKRAVTLIGEAYFDITHNPAHPFEIISGKVKVRVLGTAFDVNARNVDSIVVSVTRGKVLVQSIKDSTNYRIVTKGQSVCFVRNSFCSIESLPQNVLAWKDNVFQYKATALKDVIKDLSVYFDTTIEIDSKDKDEPLTAKIKEPKLDSVLKLLEVMYNLKRTENNKKIVLRDKIN